jgi:class 3 adenylate cyclase
VAEDTNTEKVSASRDALFRTFLFADLRGYTRYTQEHGDDGASVLAGRFAESVRETLAGFDGELLELRGDEALCVFSSARQALRAAIELQRRLRTANPDGALFPLGVGMGLDAGEAVPTEGGYRGRALNVAARLCAAAKGGEVLASDGLAHLAQPLEGVRFGSPRLMRVKGVAGPVRVVPVVPEIPLPPIPRPPGPPSRGRTRWVVSAVLAIVVLVGAAVATGLVIANRGSSHPRIVRVRGDSIAVINPTTGHVIADLKLPSPPGAVLATPQGVWVGEGNQTVDLIAPKTLRHQAIGVGLPPTNLALDGQLLLVYDGSTARGVALNAALQPMPFRVPPGRCSGGPFADVTCNNGGMAIGGGHVWLATTNSEKVWGLDPQTLKINTRPVRQVFGDSLAWGLGRLWAYGDLGQYVYAINPHYRTPAARYLIPVEPSGAVNSPILIADQQVWVVNPRSGLVVLDFTLHPQTTVRLPSAAVSATIAGGSIWVTSGDGRLYQVSLYTNAVQHTYPLHHVGAGIAVAANRVWVALDR